MNDILIIENYPASIIANKKFLHSSFCVKDLGELKKKLGTEIPSSRNKTFIS